MGDQNHRKLLPDWPSDVLASGSNKKTKNDSSSQAVMDTQMSEETPSKCSEAVGGYRGFQSPLQSQLKIARLPMTR